MQPPESLGQDDAALVAGVLAGDRQAFAGVYERYADRLHDFAYSMLRNREEAADCVADSFVAMAEKVGQLRDASRLRPWLYSVVRNECLRTLRARAREAHDDEWLAAMPDQGPEPAEQIADEAVAEELRALVWAAIEGLNDRDRALLDLHLRQGLEGAELAAAMDVTASSSYVMLSRARDQVERALGALLIARRGSDDCDDLATLLRGWDGTFSPLIRKRVARHIDGCDVCERRRRLMVSPLALLAGVPAFAAPAALRDRVLEDERLVAHYVDGPGRTTPPAPPATGGAGRRTGRLVAAAAVVLLLIGVGLVALLRPGAEEVIAVDDTTSEPIPSPSSPSSAPAVPVSPAPSATGPASASPSATTSATTSPTAATTSAPTSAAPGELRVSTRSIPLGARATSGSVRLSNVGGSTVDFEATARTGWLAVSKGSGRVAAGSATGLRITADRTGLAEGAHVGRVAVTWPGGAETITVRLTVESPPAIGPITADATSCSVPVSATVTDGSGVAAVQVRWSGAVNGETAASRSGDRWQATIPVTVGGSVTVTFTATDGSGARSSRSQTFALDPCPG